MLKCGKHVLAGLLAIGLSTGLVPWQGFAAESTVQVSLPDFDVKLNGNKVDNLYRQYPLLVYKDITYFPMTWYDSRLLGLTTDWSQEKGLSITKDQVASSYVPYKTNTVNKNSMKATIPSNDITINHNKIKNAAEQYPLLSYNDIIYFPLTWRFAHDEFGWEYDWDNAAGLFIQSDNPQLNTVPLPDDAGDNDVAVYKGYYYYVKTTGTINEVFRAPVQDTADSQLVYSYQVSTSYGINKSLNFQIKDNELWFSYHSGGAIMGYDVYCKVQEEGTATEIHRGYFDIRETTAGSVIADLSVPPGGNNLLWVPKGEEGTRGQNIGDPNLIYGWHIGNGYSGDRSMTIVGDDLYILASAYPVDLQNLKGNLNQIYRVNLKTNETKKIINIGVSHFKIIQNKLYYVKDEDHFLYSSNLDGTGEQQVSHNQVGNWYEVINGNLFYTRNEAEGINHLYKADSSQKDTLLLEESLDSVQSMNGQLLCKIASGGDYGLKILDSSGKLQLAVTDPIKQIFAYDHQIVYVSAGNDPSVKHFSN